MNCNPSDPKGAGIVDVWQEIIPVRFGLIDRSDRLTLDAVFQFFQEAAICHAENLGVGREDMARTGQAWILSRMSVKVDRRPMYRDTVTVRSWPRGFEKLFAMRNFEIKDDSGESVIFGRSGWLIVDMEKRRPLRPQTVMDMLPQNEGLETFTPEENAACGLAEKNNLQKAAERKALYTDLDYNGHVNNVRYIQWIEDTLDLSLLEKTGKLRLDINYLNEILAGEKTDILSAKIADNAYAFEGRKENGQAAFRAELYLFN